LASRGIDEQHNAVDHAESTLDLATEVGVTRGVDHVDGDVAARVVLFGVRAVVEHRGVLREDRDALFALELVGVHGAVLEVRVRLEGVGLAKHGIDEGRLAVVDVGDNCDVTQVRAGGIGHGCVP
jgi:hypothetical protein